MDGHTVPETPAPVVCAKCGAELSEDQDFCPKCGTPKKAPEGNACPRCGAILQEGQEFCHKCGQKIGGEEIPAEGEKKKKKSKKIIIPITAVAICLTVIIAGILLFPKLFPSVEDLCSKGEYMKAYEKAEEDVKYEVQIESCVAERCASSAKLLKDPSSFELREAYYYQSENDDGEVYAAEIVLLISGRNGFGGTVSSYWLYAWDENSSYEWRYFCNVSNLSREEIKSYDDEATRNKKAVDNYGREVIDAIISIGRQLSSDSIHRINNLSAAGLLDSVVAINPR